MSVRLRLLSLLACAALTGCAGASGATTPAAPPPPTPQASACALTTVRALRGVAQRIYAEAAHSTSERLDLGLVLRSQALAVAAIDRDPAAARRAIRALIATGHVVRVRLVVSGRLLADVGARTALAPVSGALERAPSATVLVSTQSGPDFVSAANALTGGGVSLRSGGRVVAGSSPAGATRLPAHGVVRHDATDYAVASFGARAFPSGRFAATIVRSLASTIPDCGPTTADTVRRALGSAVTQIYNTEAHGSAITAQAQRVAHDGPLLAAVLARDPQAIRAAVKALLHQHIVRLRIQVPGLAPVDVGGPYVLGPTTVALRAGGRTIGTAELSVQDVLGFVLLSRRIVGVHIVVGLPAEPPVTTAEVELIGSSSLRVGGYRVALRDGTPPTMTTLPDAPSTPPAAGIVRVGGRSYDVYAFQATAFPSGPLPVWALVPVA